MLEEIKKIKKIELHLHLDGSMSIELASKLSGLDINEVRNKMCSKEKCYNLEEYLKSFNFPISLMQTKENLILTAKDLIKQLIADNVIYAEIRFAPNFHTQKGLTLEEVVDSVLLGLKNSRVKTNLILCLMRGSSKSENLKIIKLAKTYLKKGVGGVDLAGDEKRHKLNEYISLFKIIKKEKIPYTIHAGETDKKDLIEVLKLNSSRIGHGVFAINDDYLMKQIKEKNILLEICPTSNIQTNAFINYNMHPIKKIYDTGINISINTDNRTVSNITLNDEYLNLSKTFKFSINDFKKINRNSLNYAFLSSKEKINILKDLDN